MKHNKSSFDMCHCWKPEEYYSHSSIQQDAAMQFLKLISLKGTEEILDVGCGDGKITATLADHVPAGSVIGMDISLEMIEFARKLFPHMKYPNLTFELQDAQKLDYCKKFDIIFSSFAIQWMPNQYTFFEKAYQSLKASGYLAALIPLNISSALETAIEAVMVFPQWSSYFQCVQRFKFSNEQQFAHLLKMNRFILSRFVVVSQEVTFSSRENFEHYVIQWFPYFSSLPQDLRPIFFRQIINKYLEIEPLLKDEAVIFKFSQLEIIANKEYTNKNI